MADAEFLQRVARKPAMLRVAKRFASLTRHELVFEKTRGGFERIEQAEPFFCGTLELRIGFGKRKPGLPDEKQ